MAVLWGGHYFVSNLLAELREPSCIRQRKIWPRSVEKHFQERSAELQIPRLRSPGFPVEVGGFLELHAPFLTERRTRCRVRCCVTGNPGRDDKGEGGSFHRERLLDRRRFSSPWVGRRPGRRPMTTRSRIIFLGRAGMRKRHSQMKGTGFTGCGKLWIREEIGGKHTSGAKAQRMLMRLCTG